VKRANNPIGKNVGRLEDDLKDIRGLQKQKRRYGQDEPKRCVACRRYFRPKRRSRELLLCPKCQAWAKGGRPAAGQ